MFSHLVFIPKQLYIEPFYEKPLSTTLEDVSNFDFVEYSSDKEFIEDKRRLLPNKNNGIVIDNIPLVGFRFERILKDADEFIGDFANLDSIIDPRGSQIEIRCSNSQYIVQNCTIENGTILEPCIWGMFNEYPSPSEQYKKHPILIPITSKLYQIALDNNKRRTGINSVPIYKVSIGDKVQLRSGIISYVIGKFTYSYDNMVTRYVTMPVYDYPNKTQIWKKLDVYRIIEKGCLDLETCNNLCKEEFVTDDIIWDV